MLMRKRLVSTATYDKTNGLMAEGLTSRPSEVHLVLRI